MSVTSATRPTELTPKLFTEQRLLCLRFNGGTTDLGRSVWLFNGVATSDIGLKDAAHTRSDGYRESSLDPQRDVFNEAGQVFGYSKRYNAGSQILGQSAWFFDGANTSAAGFVDGAHTRNDGYQYSEALKLNEAGQLIGTSRRYDGQEEVGEDAWLFDGTNTTALGLTSEYGHHLSSAARDLNESGYVCGTSSRINATNKFQGLSAWLYDGKTTVEIGLTDEEHTRTDGFRSNEAWNLFYSDIVLGTSSRYDGMRSLGLSSWVYKEGITTEIGLTDDQHTHSDGSRWVTPQFLNERGDVIGQSMSYKDSPGWSSWLFNGEETIRLGLKGSEYISPEGSHYSAVTGLNEAGHVTGFSTRFDSLSFGGNHAGHDAWIYDDGVTIQIGLVDEAHTRADGYRGSNVLFLNQNGQVAGDSGRYRGTAYLGTDAWLYDRDLEQTFQLQLSERSDGYASSQIKYLGDDGLVLGTYSLFDEFDKELANRVFYFTIEDGLHDLGLLVEGGLTGNGWEYLASAFRADGFIGGGFLIDGGQMAYALTPLIPEPNCAVLALCAAVIAARKRPGLWHR